MEYQTKIDKSATYGWTAKTDIEIGEGGHAGEKGKRVLRLKTKKDTSRAGGLETYASVHLVVLRGQYAMEIHSIGGGDFWANVRHVPCGRVTEKAVREAHEAALSSMPALIERAQAHYAGKDEAAA